MQGDDGTTAPAPPAQFRDVRDAAGCSPDTSCPVGVNIGHAQGQQYLTSRGRVVVVHDFDNAGPERDAAP